VLARPEKTLDVDLYYRHVNQAERWRHLTMEHGPDEYLATIPGEYTDSVYALQYYFVLRRGDVAWLYPGFNASLSNQPYYAIAERSKLKDL
jgi:hypothetical protein